MDVTRPDIFKLTMQGFAAAFQVRHIASFAVKACNIDDQVRDVWERHPDYDQLPVTEQGRIIGVLERSAEHTEGPVASHMRRLDETLLVSAAEPLVSLIQVMQLPPYYRLVLDGIKIDGIVTRSDLLKLPVRLLVFAMVTHLELTMAQIITTHYPQDGWFDLLSEGRRKRLLHKQAELRRRRSEPPLIELADFADKREIVRYIRALPKRFEEELEHVEQLRNQVAHAATYVEDDDDLAVLVERIQLAEKWIKQLSGPAQGG